jgi:cell division protein FtsB
MTQQINLYEARLKPRRELATARNLGVSALLLLALTSAVVVYARQQADEKTAELAVLQASVNSEQERMTALSKALGGRRVSTALVAEQVRVRTLLSTQQEVMAVLDSGQLGNTSGFSAFMFGFARQALSDMWLTGFAVSAGGEEIEIRGGLLDPAKLPGYVQRLSAEPAFKGRRFATLEMRSVEPVAPELAKPGAATGIAALLPAAKVPVASQVGSQAVAPPPPLPRYVEFVLRSAGGAVPDAVADAAGKAGRPEGAPR